MNVFTYARVKAKIEVRPRNKDVTTIKGCLLLAGLTKLGSTPGGGWIAGVFERAYNS